MGQQNKDDGLSAGYEMPKTQSQSLHIILLPEEIIEDILSRLPVKSLLRFRCISKSWRSLISNKRFIKTHHQNLTKNTAFAHHKVIFSNGGLLKQCSLNSLLSLSGGGGGGGGSGPITTDSNNIVVGCCNGLLLCIVKDENMRFQLWNPSTRISKELPDHHSSHSDINNKMIHTCGFGWDEWSGAYKVIVVLCSTSDGITKLHYKVYSSKTSLWKNLEHKDDLKLCCHSGQFVSGKLHWFGLDIEIVTLNLKSEVFETMRQPYKPNWYGHRVALGVLGGCLSVSYVYYVKTKHLDDDDDDDDDDRVDDKLRFDVWVMKQYGVQESWVKVMAVPLDLDCEHRLPSGRSLCIGPNGEILLIYASSFAVYYPKHNVFSPLEDMKVPPRAHLYIESLVSPLQQS